MSVKIKVACEIEIIQSGNFGATWTLEEIRKTGLREAIDTLNRIVAANKGKIKFVGKPKAISFIHTEDL